MRDLLKLGVAFIALAAVLFTVLGGEDNKQDTNNSIYAQESDKGDLIENASEYDVGELMAAGIDPYELIGNLIVQKKYGREITDPKHHELIKELVKKEHVDPNLVGANSSAASAEPELTVGGFADPLFYTSNFKLYLAESGSRMLASDQDTLEKDYGIKQVGVKTCFI